MPGHTLDGSIVAVVGASGVLGSLISRALADRGAKLVLMGRDEQRLRDVGLTEAPLVVADLTTPQLATPSSPPPGRTTVASMVSSTLQAWWRSAPSTVRTMQ